MTTMKANRKLHTLYIMVLFPVTWMAPNYLKPVMLIRPQVIRPRPENSRPRTFSTAQGQAKARHVQRQGQGHSRHTATALDQNKTSDVIYLLQSIAVNDKNKIPFITSASIFWFIVRIIFFNNYKFRMSSPLGLIKIITITSSFSFSSVQLKFQFQLQVMLLHAMRPTN